MILVRLVRTPCITICHVPRTPAPPTICRTCGEVVPREGRGRPRTTHYPACPPKTAPALPPEFSSPADLLRNGAGFLSGDQLGKVIRMDAPRPDRITFPPVEPSAVHDPDPASARDPNEHYEPGPIEQKLLDDMATMTTTNPLAGVLGQAAIRCARAADLADPADYKAVLAPLKELRSLVVEMTKTASGGDDDEEGQPDTVFGWGNPQVVNAPAV